VKAVALFEKDAPGFSFCSFHAETRRERKIRVLMTWYVPDSKMRFGRPVSRPSDLAVRDASIDLPSPYYKPWYSSRFKDVADISAYWQSNMRVCCKRTRLFRDAF